MTEMRNYMCLLLSLEAYSVYMLKATVCGIVTKSMDSALNTRLSIKKKSTLYHLKISNILHSRCLFHVFVEGGGILQVTCIFQ